jgi:hypothetical protein
MRFLKVEFYAYADKKSELLINLEDISYVDFQPYNYWPPQHEWVNGEIPVGPTFTDPHSIRVVMKHGGDFHLTELSGQFLRQYLPMQAIV